MMKWSRATDVNCSFATMPPCNIDTRHFRCQRQTNIQHKISPDGLFYIVTAPSPHVSRYLFVPMISVTNRYAISINRFVLSYCVDRVQKNYPHFNVRFMLYNIHDRWFLALQSIPFPIFFLSIHCHLTSEQSLFYT